MSAGRGVSRASPVTGPDVAAQPCASLLPLAGWKWEVPDSDKPLSDPCASRGASRVACDLEMWAEAFRSVEDIQSLILLQKKSPKQQSMATYYARLTQIFAVSENHLYNAYAWLKLFNFSRSFNKNMTPADFQAMSSSVLLAMLSILPYDVKQGQALDEMAVDQEKERILRMANILGYQVDANKDYRTVLSRAALLSSVGAVNVLALVPPELLQYGLNLVHCGSYAGGWGLGLAF
ncbi:eukaryotic translation initiation factor 3 subunit 10, partial [Haematococcus lacustris]